MRRPVALTTLVLLLATLATPAGASHTDESAVDLTFPVAGPQEDLRFRDDFHDPRGGGTRTHHATDVHGPKHRKIHAAVGGVVSFTPYLADDPDGPEPSYGWLLSIHGEDGRMYRYLHINNDTPGTSDNAGGLEHAFAPKIVDAIRAKGSTLRASDGVRVKRGEYIAHLGDSGNASSPHLHFEIYEELRQSSARINPYASLLDARQRGDIPGAAPAPVEDENANGAFSDLADDGAHTKAVLTLAEAGIVSGCDDTRYCPHDAIARGDLASFLAAALDLSAEHAPRFTDVGPEHEHAEAIAAVDEAGILRGFDDDFFRPDTALSRAQLTTMLVQGFDLDAVSTHPPFGDVNKDGTHTANIAAAHASGLTKGCGDGSDFCPWDDVSRGQIATFLDNALRLVR